MRITIQSFPFRPHAPAGTVTVANPSAEVTDVDALEPSAGVEERRIGAVLSIRMFVRVSCDVLPSESDTTARRSYRPSGTDVVSNAWLHGAAVSVPTGVHAFAPAGLTVKATCVAP